MDDMSDAEVSRGCFTLTIGFLLTVVVCFSLGVWAGMGL